MRFGLSLVKLMKSRSLSIRPLDLREEVERQSISLNER